MSVFKWANNGLVVSLFAFSVFMLSGCSNDDGGDKNPPVISNVSHADNEKIIGSRTVTFSADVTDDVGATVTITHNGNPVAVTASSDTYTASITLEDRTNNTIVVSASDADNITTETVTLNYPFLAFTNGQAASIVIGQPDFDSISLNRGESVSGSGLDSPKGIIVHNNRLYVADNGNSRVLGFNSIPSTYNEGVNATANFALGQLSMGSLVDGIDADQLKFPSTMATDGVALLIGQGNQTGGRVHKWDAIPISNNSADTVIGQSDFGLETTGCNEAVLGGRVDGIYTVNNKLIVSDTENNRVLIWNTIPTTNGVAADLVLGQQDFTHCTANDGNNDGDNGDPEDGPSASTLNLPEDIWSDGTRLMIADVENFRVLIWNTFPTSNFQAADAVIGQADFKSTVFPIPISSSSIGPVAMTSNGNQLFVSDAAGSRILIWNTIPSSATQLPDVVLGNSKLTVSDQLSNAAELSAVRGMFLHDNQLIVSDSSKHRVLIFEAQ